MTTKVSYSTVFKQSADQVWAVISDFNSYPVWVATVTESHIGEDKSGDAVGAIRNFDTVGECFLLIRNAAKSPHATRGPLYQRGLLGSLLCQRRDREDFANSINFVEFGTRIRQRLVAHSDLERCDTYESGEPLGPIISYQGTGRATPIIDTGLRRVVSGL